MSMLKYFARCAGAAVLAGFCGSGIAAAPGVTQVWTNMQVYHGTTSAAITPATTESFYSAYVKLVTPPASGQSVNIRFQVSPDGVNWTSVGNGLDYQSYTAAGTTALMTMNVLAAKVRLVSYSTAGGSATVTGWIVH
jgi:hypothetical protein